MSRRFFSLLLLFLLPLSSAFSDELIIEPDMGRKPLIQAMENTRYSINLTMYGFTDEELLQQLIRQKNRHKTIKVILEESPYKAQNENLKTINAFKEQAIAWQGAIPPFKLIHQKTLLLDEKKAIVMTFNFTHSSFKNERNFGLVIDDPKEVKDIAALFSADWNHKSFSPTSSQLILSPDNSRVRLLNLINQAQRSLLIYAQSVTDYKIVGALAKAARRGVKVQILTSANIHTKQADYLRRGGVTLQQSKKLYIHAKVFIIDGEKAVIGSNNLTRASLDDNRELSVLTEDKAVIAQLTKTFEKDWQSYSDLLPDNATLQKATRYLLKHSRQIMRLLDLQ